MLSLEYQYGVKKIYGVQYGYCGFYQYEWVKLDSNSVRNLQNKGGTFLGSSRGGFDRTKIIDALVEKQVSQIFILGGDGTHRGIFELYKECKSRGLNIAVVGVPKTIDNDIPLIDVSFGF